MYIYNIMYIYSKSIKKWYLLALDSVIASVELVNDIIQENSKLFLFIFSNFGISEECYSP